MKEPLIYEISSPGRTGASLPDLDVPVAKVPEGWSRPDLPLPEVAEVDLVRHYVRLSQMNYSVDTGFYPLGSCTMKYNPKVNEVAARLPGFAAIHPLQAPETVQGELELMFDLQMLLAEIAGFAAVTLQPSAGAHGELTGVLMMRKYLYDRGETQRVKILVPDSAHGTNPATTTMAGLEVIEIPSDDRGNVDLAALKANLDDTVVGLMLTEPQYARPLRRAPPGDHVARARGGRPRLWRWRQLQRHSGDLQAGRFGLRYHALQPAQDLLDAARRGRAWLRRRGCR